MRRDPFLESVWATIRNHDLLKDGDEVVVGVSGGPDSVALLRALCWIRDKGIVRCWICVAHLNHMLRGTEAEEDLRFVKRLAARLKCMCFDGAVDVRALADAQGLSIEEAAREARYTYLEQVCMGVTAGKVAMGHTADDHVETVLHRLLRGAGPAGLAGIPIRRRVSEHSPVEIIRPLLETSRSDIEAFLRRRRQKSRVDSSNFSSEYLRNRIRHKLIPLLEAEFNSNVKRAIAGLSRTCSDVADFLKRTAEKEFLDLSYERDGGTVVVPLAALRDTHIAVLPSVIGSVLQTLGVGLKQMTREHYVALGRLISAKGGEKKVALPCGVRAVRSGDRLRLERGAIRGKKGTGTFCAKHPAGRSGKRCLSPFSPARLPVPGVVRPPGGDVTISAEVLQGGPRLLKAFLPFKNQYEEMLDLDKLRPPLLVRTRRPGDRFRPLGAKGTQKLQDFMVDRKIPKGQRDCVPIVADQRHVVWVVGYRVDDRARVTSSTRRTLKLTAELH